jgi:hypothetical protein
VVWVACCVHVRVLYAHRSPWSSKDAYLFTWHESVSKLSRQLYSLCTIPGYPSQMDLKYGERTPTPSYTITTASTMIKTYSAEHFDYLCGIEWQCTACVT